MTKNERASRTAAHRKWAEQYPDRVKASRRKSWLKRKYGISVAEYEALLDAQQGVCAICHRPETKPHSSGKANMTLAVDHDHATGRVRGLLCQSCNVALGCMDDSPDRLRAAALYVGPR